jgi:hypothetical protein
MSQSEMRKHILLNLLSTVSEAELALMRLLTSVLDVTSRDRLPKQKEEAD